MEIQCLCKFFHVRKRNIFLGAFNHADVGSVHLGELSEALLGDAALEAFGAQFFAELYEYCLFVCHV